MVPDVDPPEVPEELLEGPAEPPLKLEAEVEAPQAVEEAHAGPQAEMGKPQSSEPGPYYYFYQGEPHLNTGEGCS